jgi:hypothetical protein
MKKLIVVFTILVFSFIFLTYSTYFFPAQEQDQQTKASTCIFERPIGGISKNYISMSPGERGQTTYILYSGNTSGNVRLSVYRVAGMFETEKIPMPQGINVTVTPSEFHVRPYGKYASNITVSVSSDFKVGGEETGDTTSVRFERLYLIVRAQFGNETIDDWLRVAVMPEGKPVPGLSLMDRASVTIEYNESIRIKRGEKRVETLTLYTGEAGPGKVRVSVYRVADIYSTERVRGEGVSLIAEPSCLMVKPHAYYSLGMVIKADDSAKAGEYVFLILLQFEDGRRSEGWVRVEVV